MELVIKNNVQAEAIKELAKRIKNTKWDGKVFLCGQFVHNVLLGLDNPIIDICVESLRYDEFAEWICKELNSFKINQNPSILPYIGTCYFQIKSLPHIQGVTFRCAKTQKGLATASTKLGDKTLFVCLADDARDRDTTIEALYANITTMQILDPTGFGLSDMENKIIRSVRDDSCWKGDDLYILRLIYTATKFGYKFEKNTWIKMIAHASNLYTAPQKMVTEQLTSIIMLDNPSVGVRSLLHCGALKIILPHIHRMVGCTQGKSHFGDVFEHTMAVIDKTQPHMLNRWTALFHDVCKPVVRSVIQNQIHFINHDITGKLFTRTYFEGIGLPVDIAEKASMIIGEHMRFKRSGKGLPSKKSIKKFMATFGDEETLAAALDVMHADNLGHAEGAQRENQIPYVLDKILEFQKAAECEEKEIKLPINGKDIMQWCKLQSGPQIGKLMTKAKDIFVQNPSLTKNELLIELAKVESLC